jgi:oligosaccharide repeat unit polymerase
MVLLFAVSAIVCVLSFASMGASDSTLSGETFAPSLVAVIWLGCYLLASYRAFGTAYLFATAYVLCLFVFHFGLLIQDGFGIIRLVDWQVGEMSAWAVRAAWCTNLALACLGVGFAAHTLQSRPLAMPSQATVSAIGWQNLTWLYDVGIGLLIASLIFFVGAFASFGNLMALTRLELFHLSDTRFISVFSMMAPSAAAALLLGARAKHQRWLAYAVSLLVLLGFLFSGQRSTALFPLLATAVVWVKLRRRIPPLVAGAAILGLLFVIPLVGYLRTLGTYEEIISAEAISQAADYADIGAAFREMGGSIGPLMHTLKRLPEDEPYRYGSTYLSYILDVIPNVGLMPDKSTSRAAIIEMLRTQGQEKALMAMNVGDWATFHIIPQQFASGGGAGYSGVAEPYFNFGLVGVVIYFLLLGVFLGRLDSLPLFLYRNWLLFGVVAYWHLLPTVRNGFTVFLKPAVFTLIVVFIWLMMRKFVPRSRLKDI